MTKLLKTLAGLILLLIVAALLVPFLVDPNDFRDEVVDEFAAATGRELVIAGNLKISLFPKPRLEIHDASLPGAPGFDGPPLAALDLMVLYPRLRSLFGGRIELTLMQVEGLRLNLLRDERGRANWERGEEASASPGDAQASGARQFGKPTGAHGPFDAVAADIRPAAHGPVVDRVEILDALAIWEDPLAGRRLELGDLEITAGPVAPGESMTLNLTGSLIEPSVGPTARLRAEGELLSGSGIREMRWEPLQLRLDALDLGNGLGIDVALQAKLEANLDARRYLFEDLEIRVDASGETLSHGKIDATAGARLELDLDAETLKVEGAWIRSGGLAARGAAAGQQVLSAPVFEGSLVLDELDPHSWLEHRGLTLPPTADTRRFRRLALSTNWRLEEPQLSLQDLILDVDQTRITGHIEHYATESPEYRFDVTVDGLDLDAYLPPKGQARKKLGLKPRPAMPTARYAAMPAPAYQGSKTETASGPAASGDGATGPVPAPVRVLIPLEAVGNLDLEGRLRAGELRFAGLLFGDLDARIEAREGRIDIDNQVPRFYDGRLDGRLALDLQGPDPRITLVQRAAGIQTGPLLLDLTGNERLTGRGDITANLTAAGWSTDALRRSLSGDLAIHVVQGSVKDINLELLVRETEARLTGKPPPTGLPTQTAFTDLRASAEIRGGVLSNRDLTATADYLRITGEGTVDLGRERFDYRFEPMFVQTPDDTGVKELEGIPIPVHLTGPFDHPRWNVDAASALRAVADRELKAPDGGLFKKLEERTGIKGLEQGLRGLFGR